MKNFLTMAEVLGVVAPAFEVTPHEVRGRRKSIAIAVARTAFCAMAAEFTPCSTGELGRFLDRHPGTAEAAQKRHLRFLKNDPLYKTRIWNVSKTLAEIRADLVPTDDALDAARRFVAGDGSALTPAKLLSVCERLIYFQTAFQELNEFRTELAHERG